MDQGRVIPRPRIPFLRANQCTNNRHQGENGAVKPLPVFLSGITVDGL